MGTRAIARFTLVGAILVSVVGGAQAVVQALLDVLGPDGTLVVPTQTGDNSDPADWTNPPVPRSWWPVIREQTPGFDKSRTQSRWMGVIAETVRTWPGAVGGAMDTGFLSRGHGREGAAGSRLGGARLPQRDRRR